ncbi:hypothetical protein SAMN05216474_1387 [Lishizhenia tianjinensis]|uniref:Uncharacterized protein n=1 Tax=Lishizhenia tianjinensis TaxID=477690 RepID=A0A1I6ZIH0_9FLAO|nr:hypothetical protein SAMN05216474_1387 [Lishizhenia tianjinensis]
MYIGVKWGFGDGTIRGFKNSKIQQFKDSTIRGFASRLRSRTYEVFYW